MDSDGYEYYSDEVSTLGERISVAREHTGMSVAEVAAKLAVKSKTISEWEDDSSEPRANKLVMLAGVVGVSPMWLLTGSGEGVAPPDDDIIVDENTLQERLTAELRETQEMQAALTKRINRIADAIATIS